MRLIGPWCQVNIASCRFMLAQCYLANGEGQKVGHYGNLMSYRQSCSP